jgi:hypothetical protein
VLCFVEFKVNFSEILNCRYHSKWQGKNHSPVKKQTALKGNRAVGDVADLRPIAGFLGRNVPGSKRQISGGTDAACYNEFRGKRFLLQLFYSYNPSFYFRYYFHGIITIIYYIFFILNIYKPC